MTDPGSPRPPDAGGRSPERARAEVIDLPRHLDSRGLLVAGEHGEELPFAPLRFFAISEVPEGAMRAQHANLRSAEVLVCLNGRCSVDVHDGSSMQRFELAVPHRALHVPARHWLACRDFSPGSVLVVLASHPYDPQDQISDLDEFVALVEDTDRS